MDLDPQQTTVGDLCNAALIECGAFGQGQSPTTNDINRAWARLQWMLQQWERKRFLVYHLVNLSHISTGAISYTVGPGGDFDTGVGSVRPGKLESAFSRQLQQPGIGSQGQVFPNNVDCFLVILQSREDYDKIILKSLQAGPGEGIFLDSAWPLANVYVWPVPQASVYEIHITIREQLPTKFTNLNQSFVLPYEYYGGILYNLALRMRIPYQLSTFPGDPLPGMAKDSLNVIRGPNTQIAKLRMPRGVRRPGDPYNIFSDRP